VSRRRCLDLDEMEAEAVDSGAYSETLQSRTSRHVSVGRQRRVLLQYVPALTRLVLVGAGDDARPLSDVGHSLGWHVTVLDRRARLARGGRFPTADAVLWGDWVEILDLVRITPATAVVLMTHSLEDDARVLSMLADRGAGYVGALGPAHRRQWLIQMA